MKLHLLAQSFALESIELLPAGANIHCAELENFLKQQAQKISLLEADLEAAMKSDAAAPAPAPAPVAPKAKVFELIEAANLPHTIEAFKASGWSEQQLIDAGHLIKTEVKSEGDAVPAAPAEKTPEPPAPTPAIKGQFELEGITYMMSAKAAGADYEQFKGNGWAIDDLVSQGYATIVSGGKEVVVETEEKTFPFLNGDGDWTDSAGTIWTSAYSMGSNKIPPVTNKGLFKKSRAKVKAEVPESPVVKDTPTPADKTVSEVPAAPGAAEASGVPAAPAAEKASAVPAAPGASTIGGEDEPLDDELANIVKDWS